MNVIKRYSRWAGHRSAMTLHPKLSYALWLAAPVLGLLCVVLVLMWQGVLWETVVLLAAATLLFMLSRWLLNLFRKSERTPVTQEVRDKTSTPIPESYDERRHVKHFLKRIWVGPVLVLLGFLLIFMLQSTLLRSQSEGRTGSDFALIIGLFCLVIIGFFGGGIILSYREWWKWQNWRVVAHVHDGRLGMTSPDGPRWLFLVGSSTDWFNLEEYTLFTPTKTLSEYFIFKRCQTLALLQGSVTNANLTRRDLLRQSDPPPYFLDVKDIDRIIKIQEYRQTIVHSDKEYSKSQVELLESINQQHTVLISQGVTTNRLLARIAGLDESELDANGVLTALTAQSNSLDDTQEFDR